jgi:beta-ribofuranosylaminobenzene 5'-phosphate synthase
VSGNKIVQINAYPRIHVTLVGMNNRGFRINGGIGFSISEPGIELQISLTPRFEIHDKRDLPLDTSQTARLKEKLIYIKNELRLNFEVKIIISGSLPVHSGFGSGTIIRLACIEGLLHLNEYKYDNIDLVRYSGRGGTSGIGIKTYFKGGYVFDIGQKNKGQNLLPSSMRENNTVQALVISEGLMPNWSIGICYPRKALTKSQDESQFFDDNADVTDEDVSKTLYNVVYGTLAGILEDDIDAFQASIKLIQSFGWKSLEKNLYTHVVETVETKLYANGAFAVGMSSLGPGLFFLSKNIDAIIGKLENELVDWHFIKTTINNSGRTLTIKDA